MVMEHHKRRQVVRAMGDGEYKTFVVNGCVLLGEEETFKNVFLNIHVWHYTRGR